MHPQSTSTGPSLPIMSISAMAMGIYAIRHAESGRQYIGSAVNIKRRWNRHRSRLTAGTHHSRYLQRAWAKYGPAAFVFAVLDYVDDRSELLIAEQQWLDTAKPAFNTSHVAGSTLGTTLSVEHRQKISRSLIGNTRSAGVVPSLESRRKNAAAQRGRTWTPATRAKMAGILKGRTFGAAWREKIAQTLRERGSLVAQRGVLAGIAGAVISRDEAARQLGCSVSFVRRCIDDGLIPATLLGGYYAIKASDLEACRAAVIARLTGPRNYRGEQAYNVKLTVAKVLDIRARHAAGTATMTALAREYGVSLPTIQNIVKRKKWTHI